MCAEQLETGMTWLSTGVCVLWLTEIGCTLTGLSLQTVHENYLKYERHIVTLNLCRRCGAGELGGTGNP
jgi:hypothetical protein